MVLSGLIVLAFRRDKEHIAMWGALIAYWMAGGVIQDIVGNNSIPWPDMGMASLVGLIAGTLFARTLNIRFVFVLAFMTLSFINTLWYGLLTDIAQPTTLQRSIYQDTSYGLFFASLLSICSPNLRRLYDRLRDIWGRVRKRASS